MANLSKEIYAKYICNETPCSLIHMWSSSCMNGVSTFGLNTFIGTLKFFGPIYMIKILLNWKKLNGIYLINQCKAYIRSTLYGVTYGTLFMGSMCMLMNTVGANYYNTLYAGLLSGMSIIVEAPENKMLDTLMLFNQVMEGVVNLLTYQKGKRRSQKAEALIFMFLSSILMYLFKTQDPPLKFEHLWFYTGGTFVDKLENYRKGSQKSYNYTKAFFEYASKGTFKYFCIGYALEIIKNVLSRSSKLISSPKYLLPMLFNKKNVLFGLFFGSYTFVYRCISYYLFKKNSRESPVHALLAGFIAGSTYYFRPNIQIAIIGFTTILQLLWQRLRKKLNFPNDFPYYIIVCSLSVGAIMHLRFHLDDYCPKYTRDMINIATNNLAGKVYHQIWWMIKECEKFQLLQIQ